MKDRAINGLLIIAATVAVLVLTGAIYTPMWPYQILVWVVLGLGLLVLVIDKAVNKKPSVSRPIKVWQEIMFGAIGVVAVSLFFIVFEGVLTPVATATAWGLRHYQDNRPKGQVAELMMRQRLSGNVTALRLSVAKGDTISFHWVVDCAATGLPADCNDWPTRTGTSMCDFGMMVGQQRGQFEAPVDLAIVMLAKTPSLMTPVSTICAPNNEATIPMRGRIEWKANSH